MFLIRTTGSYCVYDKQPPYCPKDLSDVGDKRCCLKAINPEDEEIKKKYNQIP